MKDDHGNYVAKMKRERLEKIAVQLLAGMTASGDHLTRPEDIVEDAIELAEEIVSKFDERRIKEVKEELGD